MSGMVIEHSHIDIKPGEGGRYVAMFPEFKSILLSLPGGVSTRLLRSQTKADSFICCLQWESMEAKAVFMADPRLKAWAAEFRLLIAHEMVDYYFDEVG